MLPQLKWRPLHHAAVGDPVGEADCADVVPTVEVTELPPLMLATVPAMTLATQSEYLTALRLEISSALRLELVSPRTLATLPVL